MHRQVLGRLCCHSTVRCDALSYKHYSHSYCCLVQSQRTVDATDYRRFHSRGSYCDVRYLVRCNPQMTLLLNVRHMVNGIRRASMWGSSSKVTDWNRAVSEAERIVGYSTSILSLRCLLSDELSNVAMQMRKLVGTGHPLLKTARKLFYDDKHNMQTRGLLVLLTAKAAGPGPGLKAHHDEYREAMVGGIYPSQRSLAEIVEMIHTAGLIHKGIVNISSVADDSTNALTNPQIDDFKFGNKMAVLSGDFLLANASTGLAALNNTQVVEVISTAIGNMMKAEFTALQDSHGTGILPVDGVTISDWEQQTFLASGSLISSGCMAALMLASHSDMLQQQAYEFGKQVALAYELNEEILQLLNTDEMTNCFSITSAPVILYLNSPHTNITRDELAVADDKQLRKLKKLVVQDCSVLKEARRLRNVYGQYAVDALQCFSKSDARSALQNIVQATTSL